MMDRDETNQELIKENNALKRRIRNLEHLEADLRRAEEALKEREAAYRHLYENSHAAIYRVDFKTGKFLEANDLFCEYLGCRREDLASLSPLEIMTEESQRRFLERMDKMSRGIAVPETAEYEVVGRNGRPWHVRLHNRFIYDGDGKVVASDVIATDVPERKRSEDALLASEARLKSVISTSQEWIWAVDTSFRHTFCNPAVEDVLGYRPEEIVQRDLIDLLHEEDIPRVRELVAEATAQKRGWSNFVARWRHRDGTYRCLESNAVPVLDGAGALVGFQGADRDITKRMLDEEALRESERKYRLLTEKMTDIVWISDLDLRTTYVTPSVRTVLGFSQEERMLQTVDQQLTPQSLSFGLEAMAREFALEEQGLGDPKRSVSLTLEYYHKDGSTRWMETIISGIRNDQGVLTGLHGVSRDITDRRRAEKRLQRQNAFLASINETALGLMQHTDLAELFQAIVLRAMNVSETDEAWISIYDPLRKEFEFKAAIGGRGYEIGSRIVSDRGINGEVVRTERTLLLDDYHVWPQRADIREYEVRRATLAVPMKTEGRIAGILGLSHHDPAKHFADDQIAMLERLAELASIALDNARLYERMKLELAERKQAEETLHKSEEKYRQLAETAHDIIVTVDLDFKITYVNKATNQFTGGIDPVGKSLLDFTPPHLHEVQRAMMQKRREGFSDMLAFEWDITHPAGKIVTFDIRATLLTDAGKPSGVMFMVRDVTERKQLEERLNRAEKMEGLGRLAGGVAHDLNNILGVLVGYSELLGEMLPKGSPLKGHADNILQAGLRGAAIIQDLLTLARRGVTVSDVVDLNRIVSDYLKTPEFKKLRSEHPEVTLRMDLADGLLNIKGSPIHLSKTIANLAANAAEAISGPGEITIRTENRYLDVPIQGYDQMREGDYAVLAVSDTGHGIADKDIGKIFEPFYTKKVMGKSGTGLGLAVVWGTVKDHNGYIDVQSREGKGSVFTLYLPVTREEGKADAKRPDASSYRGRGERILVVDDVKEQRELAVGMLQRLGYEVEAVAGGAEAIEFLRSRTADLVVLDMIMDPGIDGLETYRRILEINAKQKAILVSGFSETDRVREAQKLGAGAYIRKPYVMERIGSAIRDELLKKSR